MQIPDDRYEPISVDEAASRLKVSPSTVRRMIRDGKLQAEREQRPQGEIVRVLWPAATDVPPPVTTPSEPPSTQMPDAFQGIATGLLERLEAQDATVAAKDAEIARINAENADLRERAARAETRADMLAVENERLRRPWWRRLLDS